MSKAYGRDETEECEVKHLPSLEDVNKGVHPLLCDCLS